MTSVEVVHHPTVDTYARLLASWEKAYQDKEKAPTPEHVRKFNEVDEVVKAITVIIKSVK